MQHEYCLKVLRVSYLLTPKFLKVPTADVTVRKKADISMIIRSIGGVGDGIQKKTCNTRGDPLNYAGCWLQEDIQILRMNDRTIIFSWDSSRFITEKREFCISVSKIFTTHHWSNLSGFRKRNSASFLAKLRGVPSFWDPCVFWQWTLPTSPRNWEEGIMHGMFFAYVGGIFSLTG